MTETKLKAWLTAYKNSWERQDADTFVELFTADCSYRDTPFVEPVPGHEFRAFWTALSKVQKDNHIEFVILAMQEDRAIINWHATSTRRQTGERTEGDGIFVLQFARDGRCREVREWQHWHALGAPPEKRSLAW